MHTLEDITGFGQCRERTSSPVSHRVDLEMLTDQQLLHYQTFGFVILRRLFDSEEMATISEEFERGLNAAYAHASFDGSERQFVTMLGPETPFFQGILEDPRFCEAAEQFYGDDVLGMSSSANRYVGDSSWHPDHNINPAKDCFGVKFAWYLEPVGADSGALRIIPGTYRNPFHDEVQKTLTELKQEIDEVPCYVCESEPGDVIAFDMRCWHASCGGAAGRRMCTAVYYNNPKTPIEEAAARIRASSSLKAPAQYNRPNDPLYHPHWVANPGGSKKRQGWIDRIGELGFLDQPTAEN